MSPSGLSGGDGGGTGGGGGARGDGGCCDLTTAFEISRLIAKCVANETKAMTQSAFAYLIFVL